MVDRVYQRNVADTPPEPPAEPVAGYPTNGDPTLGVPPTTPGEYWYYMITESLRAVVVNAGLEPDHLNIEQLSDAIYRAATTDHSGIIRLATSQQTRDGTRTDRAVHPAGARSLIEQYGLGADTAGDISDFFAVQRTAFYRDAGSTANQPPGFGRSNVIYHRGFGDSAGIHAIDRNSGRLATAGLNSDGEASDWNVYARENQPNEFASNQAFNAGAGVLGIGTTYRDVTLSSQGGYFTQYLDKSGEYGNGWRWRTHGDGSGFSDAMLLSDGGDLSIARGLTLLGNASASAAGYGMYRFGGEIRFAIDGERSVDIREDGGITSRGGFEARHRLSLTDGTSTAGTTGDGLYRNSGEVRVAVNGERVADFRDNGDMSISGAYHGSGEGLEDVPIYLGHVSLNGNIGTGTSLWVPERLQGQFRAFRLIVSAGISDGDNEPLFDRGLVVRINGDSGDNYRSACVSYLPDMTPSEQYSNDATAFPRHGLMGRSGSVMVLDFVQRSVGSTAFISWTGHGYQNSVNLTRPFVQSVGRWNADSVQTVERFLIRSQFTGDNWGGSSYARLWGFR